jgi:hypothetical protein
MDKNDFMQRFKGEMAGDQKPSIPPGILRGWMEMMLEFLYVSD